MLSLSRSVAPRAAMAMQPAATRAFASSRASADTVGFIGLGNMGGHMAANLAKAGHSVVGFDVAPDNLARAVDAGVTAATSSVDVADKASTLITMLPSSPHVKAVYLEGGVLDHMTEGDLVIDCSTIDPGTSREVSAAAAARKIRMVDAPVSGGVGGAEAGTLTFMVGGEAADFESSNEVLQHMGKNIVHCGGAGTGQIAKLCNNLILGISMTAVAEGMNLGKKLGIDPSVLAGIVNTSSGRCWSSDTYNPTPGVMDGVPSSRDYTGGFAVKLMQKDLGLAADAAKSVNAPLPTGGATYNLFSVMSNSGYADLDFSSVFKLLQGTAGSAK